MSVNGKCTWTKTLNMHYFVRTLIRYRGKYIKKEKGHTYHTLYLTPPFSIEGTCLASSYSVIMTD